MSAIIGISGKIGCGKTTLAKYIAVRAQVKMAVRLSFGDLIKRECAAYFGFPVAWCYTQEGKEKALPHSNVVGRHTDLRPPMTVRQALQWYGTDFRRAQDPAYWLKALRSMIDAYAQHAVGGSVLIVIDDVRMPDEAALVLELGGKLVRLDPYPGWAPGEHAGHITETALDTWPTWALRCAPSKGGLNEVAIRVQELWEASNG